MYQKLIATTTLGELVGVGERFSEGTQFVLTFKFSKLNT